MAVTALQLAVSSTASLLVTVPPGPCTVVLSNTSGHTVYIGNSNSVTTTNGFPIPTGVPPVTIHGYVGSVASPLWAIHGVTSASSLGVMISTTH